MEITHANGPEVSFRNDKNVLNLGCGDVCTTVNILKATEWYTLRW